MSQDQNSVYNDPRIEEFVADRSSNQAAVYVQDEIRIRPWLLVNGGLRYDRYERFARTTPRGAVIVMPSPNQSFKYLYGRAFRAPNVYELYYFELTTPDLRSESIGTHEVVWEQYVGQWLRTSASAYRYSASDLISLDVIEPGSIFSAFAFFNRGTVEAGGVELEGEVRTRSGFQALGSFAVQRAVDADDQPLTNSPKEMAKLRLGAPGPIKDSVAALEVLYLAPRRTVAGSSVSATTLVNVTFTARINPSLELLGSITNLFDRTYFDPASDEHPTDDIQQNGRTARIGLRWNLWTRKP